MSPTPPLSPPADDRRLDIFRRRDELMCIARSSSHGSLALLFHGASPEAERKVLGGRVLQWLEASRRLPAPEARLPYPDALLPAGWGEREWADFMAEAALCGIARVHADRLRLRPYKNLHPVGEEFSHEGGHALDCSPSAEAVGAGVRAALEVSHAISQVRQNSRKHSGAPRLSSAVTEHLARLGARLFERPPRPEVVEVSEGFFVLPAPLRQLLFDVVWKRKTILTSRSGPRRWKIEWYPITDISPLRAFPLMRVATDGDLQALVRLDTSWPADPAVYFLDGDGLRDPARVLGKPDGEAPPAGRLSALLASLETEPS